MKRRLRTVVSIVLGAAMFYVVVGVGRVIYVEVAIAPVLRTEFNFQTDTPYAPVGRNGEWREVGELTYVASSGRLGKAGFRSGDVLADMQLYEFYLLLDAVYRGHSATVEILRGAQRADRQPERLTFEIRPER